MKDLKKYLPISISVLTFVMVSMMWLDFSPTKEKGKCCSMQSCCSVQAKMSQGMRKMRARTFKEGAGPMKWMKEGKRASKKEAE